jgi:hypothetical protein
MNVLEFPPKQFFKTKVNLESLYGTCNYVLFLQFSLKLEITETIIVIVIVIITIIMCISTSTRTTTSIRIIIQMRRSMCIITRII